MFPPKDVMNEQGFGKERFKRPGEGDAGTLSPVGAFGPPKFEANAEQVQEAYQHFLPEGGEEDNEDYAPELEPPYEEEFDDENVGYNPPPVWEGVGDMPMPPSFRQEGAGFLRDEPLFEGGPMRSEVNSWKKQFEMDGHTVHLSEVGDEVFIWRTLARTEYREVMALPNTDPLQREEIFCEICTLWPYNYNFTTMAVRKAGVPAILAEQIMHESGFKKPSPPIRL